MSRRIRYPRLLSAKHWFGVVAVGAISAVIATEPTAVPPRVQEVYDSLSDQIMHDELRQCARRADVWVWQLRNQKVPEVRRVMVYFSQMFNPNTWGYHNAPVVDFGGKTWVLEKANGLRAPMELSEWLAWVGKGSRFGCSPMKREEQAVQMAFSSKKERGADGKKEKIYHYEGAQFGSAECYWTLTPDSVGNDTDFYRTFYQRKPAPELTYASVLESCETTASVSSDQSPARMQVDRFCADLLKKVE